MIKNCNLINLFIYSIKKLFNLTLFKNKILIFIFILFFLNSYSITQGEFTKIETPHYLGIKFIHFIYANDEGTDNIYKTNNTLPYVTTFGYDRNLIKWDISNLEKINSMFINNSNRTSLNLNVDKQILNLSLNNNEIIFINLENFTIIKSFKVNINSQITNIQLMPDNSYFTIIDMNNNLYIYSYEKGNLVKTIKNEGYSGYNSQINLNNRIAIFYKNNKLTIYSLYTYNKIKQYELPSTETIFDIKLDKNDKLYITTLNGKIYKIDISTVSDIIPIYDIKSNIHWIKDFYIDNNNIFYITSENKIYVYNTYYKQNYEILKSNNEIFNITLDKYGKYIAYTDLVNVYIIKSPIYHYS